MGNINFASFYYEVGANGLVEEGGGGFRGENWFGEDDNMKSQVYEGKDFL